MLQLQDAVSSHCFTDLPLTAATESRQDEGEDICGHGGRYVHDEISDACRKSRVALLTPSPEPEFCLELLHCLLQGLQLAPDKQTHTHNHVARTLANPFREQNEHTKTVDIFGG